MRTAMLGEVTQRLGFIIHDFEPIPSGVPGRIEIVDPVTEVPIESLQLGTGESIQLAAIVYDAAAPLDRITGLTVTWVSSNPSAVSVDPTGLVEYVSDGAATIQASVNSAGGNPVIDAAAVTSASPAAVASVVNSAVALSGDVGAAWSFTTQPKDASGNSLAGRVVTATAGAGNSVSGVPVITGYTISGTFASTGIATIVVTCEGVDSAGVAVTVTVPGVGIDPGDLTDLILYAPAGLELPATYISGSPANAAAYGLSLGKARAEASATGIVAGGEYIQKWPQGMKTGVSPGNNLHMCQDHPSNTDGNHVDSWEEMLDEVYFRMYGPPGHEDRWEILSATGTAKLFGFHGIAEPGNQVVNQIIILFRALPRSQSPWGPGVYQGEAGSGGYAVTLAQQGLVDQTGAPNAQNGAASYQANFNGYNAGRVVFQPDPLRIYRLQTYIKMNAIGVDDGILRIACDPVTPDVMVQTHEYTNCRWRDAANPRGWYARAYSPTLGGSGPGTKQEDSFMAFSSWRIAVKTQVD